MALLVENQSLKSYNTFGIDVKAKFFVKINKPDDLIASSQIRTLDGLSKITLGGGSNILFTKDHEGLVLLNQIMGVEVLNQNKQFLNVRFGAGENWHKTVLWSLQNNLGGIENLSLIPGTVGAAPIQNIGAYGQELQNVFIELRAFHLDQKKFFTLSKDEMDFGYRNSVFKNDLKGKAVITDVTLRLSKNNHQINASYASLKDKLDELNIQEPSIQDISKAVIAVRQSKLPDPEKLGNAGSFFKNPVITKEQFKYLLTLYSVVPHYVLEENLIKVPAAWLIDRAGWKNFRKNNVGTYSKQPLVLVNYGNSTGLEIQRLAEDIIHSVKSRFKIYLQPEVNIW